MILFHALFRKFRIAICCLGMLAGSKLLHAQVTDSSKAMDSANAAMMADYKKTMAEMEKRRLQDSIRKADLEEKIKTYNTTDIEKERLQKQIDQLNQADSLRVAAKKAHIDSMRASVKGYAVTGFFDDTLFLVYGHLGSFSAADRAIAIKQRINTLADKLLFSKDSLQIEDAEYHTNIVYKDVVLMSISENDALWNNTSQLALANRYKQIIGNAVAQYRKETSWAVLGKEIAMALLLIPVIVLIIYLLRRFFRWTAGKIAAQEGKLIKEYKIKNYTLLNAQKQVQFFTWLNNILKWFFILLTIYFALPVLFGIFPWTKNLTGLLLGYLLTPVKNIGLAIWHYLPNLFTIAVILVVFRYAIKGLRYLKSEIAYGRLHITGFYPEWAEPTFQIMRVLSYAFILVVIFPYLPGSDSPIFKGVSVFLGFLFTFGSAGSLSNLIAGFVLTYMRLFKLGDRIQVGDVTGDVIEKNMLVTRVRTIKNEIISIPNSAIMSSHTINYSSDAAGRGLILHTTVTIGYDVPWRDMHRALTDAALQTNGIIPDPAPFVLQTGLQDFYVSYQLNAYTKEANKQVEIYSLLHQNILDICNERGIEIMSPHYAAVRDGSHTTIPTDHLSASYKAPGFNVNIENNAAGH